LLAVLSLLEATSSMPFELGENGNLFLIDSLIEFAIKRE